MTFYSLYYVILHKPRYSQTIVELLEKQFAIMKRDKWKLEVIRFRYEKNNISYSRVHVDPLSFKEFNFWVNAFFKSKKLTITEDEIPKFYIDGMTLETALSDKSDLMAKKVYKENSQYILGDLIVKRFKDYL